MIFHFLQLNALAVIDSAASSRELAVTRDDPEANPDQYRNGWEI
jgi:hypothetical protein